MKNIQEYKVLARKYRPQTFADLIGQESLVKILTSSIENNRIPHAYVLTGVRGVGKTTTARLIAMSINCFNRKSNSFEPCSNCDSCISIREDHNMDVIEMDAASKTGVDDIREIIDNVKYKPVNSSFKIFIIDEVHMLSKNAFNALLKTLEEPPDHVKFIFATTEVKKIPVTILSRCQRFDLHRVENIMLSNHLLKIAKLEDVNIEKDALAIIIRSAEGSVRDAISLLDQSIAHQTEKIDVKLINDMLGLADRGKIFDLLDSVFQGNASKSLKIYNELYQNGADIIMIFDEMLSSVHFITQTKIAPDLKEDAFIPESERNRAFELSSKLSMASLGLVWQILFKGYQELQAGLHLVQHGEMIILRLIYLYDGPGPKDLLEKYEENLNISNDIKNKNYKISSAESKEEKILNKENLKNKITKEGNFTENKMPIQINSFRNFVDLFYHKKEGMLHTNLYNNAKVISFKEGEIVLNIEKIKDKHFNRTIAKLISKWTGRIWQIQSSSSNVGKSLFEEDLINQQNEIESMNKNPEIKKILNEFPGIKIHSINNIKETENENINEFTDRKEKEV